MNCGDLPKPGYFEEREKPLRSAERKAKSWREHPSKIPEKPFSLMKERNLKRA